MGEHGKEDPVKKDVDCQVFEDQIDAFSKGELSEEGLVQLRLHAETCPECAMQLRVQEHLAIPSLEELESAVPDEVLAAVWPGIRGELAERKAGSRRRASGRVGGAATLPGLGWLNAPWLRPALAAATLIWAVGTGVLFSELRQSEAREEALVQRIAELDVRSEAAEHTADLAGRSPLIRALSREGSVSIAALQDRLRNLPGNTVVLDAAQIEALLSNRSLTRPVGLRAALVEIAGREEISARELLRLLDASDVNPEMTVPTSRLMQLLD